MLKRAPVSGADEVRMVLASAEQPLTCAEILARCALTRTTTQVACKVHLDVRAGLVERSGAAKAYRYALTADGLRAAANPNFVRSHARRRTRGRRVTKTAVLTEAIAHARPAL